MESPHASAANAGRTGSLRSREHKSDENDDQAPSSNSERGRPDIAGKKGASQENLTVLQKHIQFWDRDNDGIIYPWDVYNGFRELGFNFLFSIGSLLIPIFFSYPTRLGHSLLPDPLFRIFVNDIHKAKHGSDTHVYDLDGNFEEAKFEGLFERFDSSGIGALTATDLCHLWAKDRCAADPAGWSFAAMEWWTTWLLLQRKGLVWKDDLRACYDGSLFWKIKQERESREGKDEKSWLENFLELSMLSTRK